MSYELDALYADADSTPDHSISSVNMDPRVTEAVLPYLRAIISRISGLELQDGDNFFAHGMDSLQALLITRNLKQALGLADLTISDIYANPSILSLVEALKQFSKQEYVKSPNEKNRLENLEVLLAKYRGLIDQINPPANHNEWTKGTKNVFLLTGSTGALGSHLLHTLLANSSTAHVYCLNRTSNGASQQVQRNNNRGLPTEFPEDRITFLSADLSKSNLGLSEAVYAALVKRVTNIIHNAWPVNFQMPLSSFEPQLMGLVHLVKFGNETPLPPSLLYISSISAVSSLDKDSGSITTIPENVVDDITAPAAMGYGESKYLAERILNYAVEKLGLQIKIARIGQIAGPVEGPGLWNRAEWFPSLIISSLFVGAVPISLGKDLDKIDWIPIDALAEILLEICQTAKNDDNLHGAKVFNLLNLHQVEWEDLLPTVTGTLSTVRCGKATIETVGFESWIRMVEEKMGSGGNNDRYFERIVEVNPAIKLVEFYREEAVREQRNEWDTSRAKGGSEKLRTLGGVERLWMANWIRGWVG